MADSLPAEESAVAPEASSSVPDRFVRFVRFLRREGFDIGIQETLDSLEIARCCGSVDECAVREGLRSLLCMSRDDWRRFDLLFEYFWLSDRLGVLDQEPAQRRDPRISRQGSAGGYAGLSHMLQTELLAEEAGQGNKAGSGGAGRQTALARSDFRFLTERGEMLEMERLAERLARRLRRRLIRRYRDRHRGEKVHMRCTIRKSLAFGGLPVALTYRQRKRQLPRFVLLLDVSHSMAQYSYLLARFARGLVLTFQDAEAFVFHTRLYRVTELFRETDADSLRRRLAGMTQLWFGGTRIADSLQHFNRRFARRVVSSKAIVLIMSDGFDSDAPQALATELRILRARARKILWLNPMLGRKGFSTDEGAMSVVLPWLDLLAPAHSLESLEAVERYLAGL